tara:strand:+ start:91 stop:591 length:501 start_codon:yes stop_codon:yes gene_type:complete
MHLVCFPTELMYIIIEFLDTRDIRNMMKVCELRIYRPIFNKYIEKEQKAIIDFHQRNQRVAVEMNIRYDIKNISLGLERDSGRWTVYMINKYQDKLGFFENLLPKIKENPIEKTIKSFFNIVRIMVEKYGHKVTSDFISPFKFRPTFNELFYQKIKHRRWWREICK